jgi:16S rRNA (guanine966-N2)-methyltransferase
LRGRRVEFPVIEDLRPTPDRVRETLFNWLSGVIVGAQVLDACAGSGVLGLEALSRGAQSVCFVERSALAAREIERHLGVFKLTNAEVKMREIKSFLNGPATAFDVIFLDPPYRLDWADELCTLLLARGWLKPKGYVYVERAHNGMPWDGPDGLNIHRHLKAGAVDAYLLTRNEDTPRENGI